MKSWFIALALIIGLQVEFVQGQNNVDQFIRNVTEQTIIPVFTDSMTAAQDLDSSSHNFCSEPGLTNFSELQTDWMNAMQSWSGARLFKFGPMIEDNIDLKIHYLPIRKNQIKDNLKSILNSGDMLPVSARGLATLEYLIFDREKSQQDSVNEYSNKEKLCNYLTILTEQLVIDNKIILSNWNNSFAAQFKSNDGKITQTEALEKLFRAMISYFESVTRNGLERPSGIKTGQASPFKTESWRSSTSTNNMMAGINTFEKFLQIDSGLADLLNKNNQTTLADRLILLTAQLRHSLEAIKPDLFTAVTESPESVNTAYNHYIQLTDSFKNAAEVLNIQIGFNDQDGD